MEPHTVRTHLNHLLGQLDEGLSADDCEITPVHAGMSGASFFVTQGQRRYVLRAQPRERLPGHWAQLVRLSTLAGRVGVGPRVCAVDHGRRLMLTERIAEVSFVAAMGEPGRGAALLGQLGRTVGRMHNTPLPEGLEARSVEVRTRELYRILEERGPVPGAAREAMRAFEGAGERSFSALAPVLCHHDLNPSNLLYDGTKLWCIDWETAGAGDGFGDLATLVNFMLLDRSAIECLMEGYFAERGAAIEHWPQRLRAARGLAYLCYGVSFLELISGALTGYGDLSRSTLAGIYRAMGEGRLDPATDEGRWAFGGAMFRGYAELDSAEL